MEITREVSRVRSIILRPYVDACEGGNSSCVPFLVTALPITRREALRIEILELLGMSALGGFETFNSLNPRILKLLKLGSGPCIPVLRRPGLIIVPPRKYSPDSHDPRMIANHS